MTDIQFEEVHGVKVDLRIPEQDRRMLYEQWQSWKRGEPAEHTTLERANLLTRYDFFTVGGGAGLPPDPFKPLALQHEGADLEAVIRARREYFPPGKELQSILYYNGVPNAPTMLGLRPSECALITVTPDIDEQGRIAIPEVIGVYDERTQTRLDLPDEVIAQLQFPTFKETSLESSTVREFFDYEGGYRIELQP